MNSSETVISFKLEQSVFNSDETEILATAFEKAWAFVEFDPKLEALESRRRSELARCLMMLLKLGETKPSRFPPPLSKNWTPSKGERRRG
jgi:hypothetical protein